MEKGNDNEKEPLYLGVWVDEYNCEIYGTPEAFSALADEIHLALKEERDFLHIKAKPFKKELYVGLKELREVTSIEFVGPIDEKNQIEIVKLSWKEEYGCQAILLVILLLTLLGLYTIVNFISNL